MDSLEREVAVARQERSDAIAAANGQLAELHMRLREVDAARQAEQLALREELATAKVPSPFGAHAASAAWQCRTVGHAGKGCCPFPLLWCSHWWMPLSKASASGKQRARHRLSVLLRTAPWRCRVLKSRLRTTHGPFAASSPHVTGSILIWLLT